MTIREAVEYYTEIKAQIDEVNDIVNVLWKMKKKHPSGIVEGLKIDRARSYLCDYMRYLKLGLEKEFGEESDAIQCIAESMPNDIDEKEVEKS